MAEFLRSIGGLAIITIGVYAIIAAFSGKVSRVVLAIAAMVAGAALIWGPVSTWESVGTTAAGWLGELVG